MAALTNRLLKDTLDLVTLYNTNLRFRTAFDRTVNQPGVIFRWRPVRLYIKVLASFLPPYRHYYSRFKTDPNSAQELLTIYYRNRHGELTQLEQAANNPQAKVFGAEEHRQIEAIDSQPHADTPQKVERINKYNELVDRVDQKEERARQNSQNQTQKETRPERLQRLRQIYRPRQPTPRQAIRQTPAKQAPVQKTNQLLRSPRLLIARLRTVVSSAPVQNIASQGKIVGRRLAVGAIRGVGSLMSGLGTRLLTGGGARGALAAARGGGAVAGAAARGVVAAGGALGGLIVAGGLVSVVVIGVIVVIGVLAWYILSFGTPTIGFPGTPGVPGGGGEIANCTFYREGDRKILNGQSALKFAIAEWPALISEVSSKVGVPAAVIAALLRVECPDCFATTNPDYIKNDYDNHPSDTNEAFGAIQFKPTTFEEVFRLNQTELQTKFGKTSVDSNPSNNSQDATILRIYSVRDSVIAAAFKIRADARANPPYDRDAIINLVRGYYGGCIYPQGDEEFSYCLDVHRSYTECLASQPPPVTGPIPQPVPGVASCPVVGGRITTLSFQADPVNGHCGSSYSFGCSRACPTTGRRAKAIDVFTGGPSGLDVVLPRIENKPTQWEFIQALCAGSGTYPNCSSSGGGTGALYTLKTVDPILPDVWHIQFLHMLVNTPLSVGGIYPSGTAVGKTDNTNHVHTTIGRNIDNPYSSGTEATDCDPGWLPSDFICQ